MDRSVARLRGVLPLRQMAKTLLGLPVAAALRWRLRLSARSVGLAVVYHRVDRDRGDPSSELLPALDIRRFTAHVRHLKRCYRVVPASELRFAAARRRRGGRIPVSITFDDDLPGHAKTVAPILSRHRVTATFFLCGASLEEPFGFWWERLQRAFDQGADVVPAFAGQASGALATTSLTIHAAATAIHELAPSARSAVVERLGDIAGPDPAGAAMSAGDVRALAAAGFEIGFHTREHESLTALDEAALDAALHVGRAELEDQTGGSLDVIAYPYGETAEHVALAARAAGYRTGFGTDREPVRPESDPLCLGRYEPMLASAGTFAYEVARTLGQSLPDERDG